MALKTDCVEIPTRSIPPHLIFSIQMVNFPNGLLHVETTAFNSSRMRLLSYFVQSLYDVITSVENNRLVY